MFKKGVNSYLNLDEADELIADVDAEGIWKGLSEDKRVQHLITAALHIDSLILSSRKHSSEQSMQFPRGRSTEIPRAVLMAQALEALELSNIQSAQRAKLQEQGVTSIKLGNTSESYSGNNTAKSSSMQMMISTMAYNLMRPYLLGSAVMI